MRLQGRRKKPRTGTSQPSKASPIRSLNSSSTKRARRGEINAKSATRQPIAETIPPCDGSGPGYRSRRAAPQRPDANGGSAGASPGPDRVGASLALSADPDPGAPQV